VLALALAGCSGRGAPPSQPAVRVIEASADSLMAIPGVVGVYEGLSGRETVIRIMLAAALGLAGAPAAQAARRLPRRAGGHRADRADAALNRRQLPAAAVRPEERVQLGARGVVHAIGPHVHRVAVVGEHACVGGLRLGSD
jgi:hypothetical protein